MEELADPKQTTLSELSKYDGLLTLSGDGKGNVIFKGNTGRKINGGGDKAPITATMNTPM